MKTSIFIRTYPKDFPWLIPCLRSIGKYCTGFHEVVVHVDPDQTGSLGSGVPSHVKIVTSPVLHKNGYINQQIAKLNADRFCEGDLICFHDSDCLFTRPNTPLDLLRDGRPMMIYTPYSQVGDAICWKAPTEECLQTHVDYEFMRRFPLTYRASTLKNLRSWFPSTGRGLLDNHIARRSSFSEFNALGAYAFIHERGKYSWIDSSKDPLPTPHVRQFYSHAGLDANLSEINAILN